MELVKSIQHRNEIENNTWEIHRYFIDFESRIDIELSTSNQCQCFNLDSPFIIDEISTNTQCGISMSNRWRIDVNVPTGPRSGCVPAYKPWKLFSNFVIDIFFHYFSDLVFPRKKIFAQSKQLKNPN